MAKAVEAMQYSAIWPRRGREKNPQRLSRPLLHMAQLGRPGWTLRFRPPGQRDRTNERTSASGGFPPPAFGATLRVRFVRVRFGCDRLLLREVLARSVRRILRDDPRSVLRFVRTGERLAKVATKRLRIATDLVRERLRRVRFVCHFPSLRAFVDSHMHSVANVRTLVSPKRGIFVRAFAYVRTFVFVRANPHMRNVVTPPTAPPKGPRVFPAVAPERSGLAVRFSPLSIPRQEACNAQGT